MVKCAISISSLAISLLAAFCATIAQGEQVTIFAASSLKTALDEIAADFHAETGHETILAYDGSARLAGQILQGAPADLFISAAREWMIAAAPSLQSGSVRAILGNDLVLIVAGEHLPQEIGPGFDVAGLLNGGRLAVGQVDTVPAGQYARQALTAIGLWPALADRLAEADSARNVLDLVARGEAPAGMVYASDLAAGLAAGMSISLVGQFPGHTHAPIVYHAALVAGAGPAAVQFLDYLSQPQARTVFEQNGFRTVLP